MKLEPTKAEKKFFKTQKVEIATFVKEEMKEQKQQEKAKTKDLLCMGLSKKATLGPNPLSVLRKTIKKQNKGPKVKKRRLRKGIRSKLQKQAPI